MPKKGYPLSLFFLFFAIVLYSQSFTLEDVMSSWFPSGLTTHPELDKAAWVFNDEGKRNIWIADGPEFINSRQITRYQQDDGQSISNLIFTKSGDRLLYVRGGAPNRRGEVPNPISLGEWPKREIWMIREGAEPELVHEGSSASLSPDDQHLVFIHKGQVWLKVLKEDTAAAPLFKIRGGVSQLRWSPDGSKLAFISNRGDHGFTGIFDIATGEVAYLSPSVDRDSNPAWSPDGNSLVWIREPNERSRLPFIPRRSAAPWSVLKADVRTGKVEVLWTAREGTGSAFRFVSARNQLFYSSDGFIVFPYERDGFTHLFAVNAAGGPIRNLTPGNFEVQFVDITQDGKQMIYSSNHKDIDRQHVWVVSIASGRARQISKGTGIEWSPKMTRSGAILSLASGAGTPAHVALLNENGQRKNIVPASIPSGFPTGDLVQPEQVIFPAADGMRIHGQLFRPKTLKTGQKAPAVIFFHGGSRRQMLLGFHHRGYYHNAYALNQYLASRGYVVLSVNYRSGIGYGMEFREAINYGARGASEFNDVLGAGLYLAGRNDVEPTKIGLWGGSYGGYLTALGLAKASDLFAAGVDIHGVHDWNVVIRNFVPTYNAAKRQEVARLAFESSPMAYMDTWKSPVLIIHGDDDRNVPFSESVDLAEALRKQEVYFEQLIFPDEVHGFLLHKNWLAAYEATTDFFDRFLKSAKH